MDREAMKVLLASYRPEDANDPIFAEALREIADDPELAAWFEDAQRFDALMTTKFREVSVPHEVRGHILLGAMRRHPATRAWLPWKGLFAIAAALAVITVCTWRIATPRPRSHHLAMRAIAYTSQMPALQFVCFDAAAVASWVNGQPAAQRMNLSLPKPGEESSMLMIGSSVVEWNGQPVVMVCLQNGQRMAMLYILTGDDAGAALQEGASETVQREDWVVRTTKTGGQVRVLTARGQPEDLNFSVPF